MNNDTCSKIIILFFSLLLIIVVLIKRFLYFRPSSKFILPYESYKALNIKHLYAWESSVNSNKIVIICPGNKGNISYHSDKIKQFNNLGYNVLIFDYSGYGLSKGIPTEEQLFNDVSIVTATVRQTYEADNIILYGQFIGAPIATYAVRRYNIPILILEAPLPSMQILFKQYLYSKLQILSNLFQEFNTLVYLNGYLGKSLCIYSLEDELITPFIVQSVTNLCTESIETTGTHNHLVVPYEKIKRFIDTYS